MRMERRKRDAEGRPRLGVKDGVGGGGGKKEKNKLLAGPQPTSSHKPLKMSAARTGCLPPHSIPSIIFPSNTPLLLLTLIHTHTQTQTQARGYLADTLS